MEIARFKYTQSLIQRHLRLAPFKIYAHKFPDIQRLVLLPPSIYRHKSRGVNCGVLQGFEYIF
jgi:hypothetical protein